MKILVVGDTADGNLVNTVMSGYLTEVPGPSDPDNMMFSGSDKLYYELAIWCTKMKKRRPEEPELNQSWASKMVSIFEQFCPDIVIAFPGHTETDRLLAGARSHNILVHSYDENAKAKVYKKLSLQREPQEATPETQAQKDLRELLFKAVDIPSGKLSIDPKGAYRASSGVKYTGDAIIKYAQVQFPVKTDGSGVAVDSKGTSRGAVWSSYSWSGSSPIAALLDEMDKYGH